MAAQLRYADPLGTLWNKLKTLIRLGNVELMADVSLPDRAKGIVLTDLLTEEEEAVDIRTHWPFCWPIEGAHLRDGSGITLPGLELVVGLPWQ
jgi:hypothetical protein